MAGHRLVFWLCVGGAISIHALREEGDASTGTVKPIVPEFLSTPSARRATCSPPMQGRPRSNFYPRPPRGGRRTRMPPWTLLLTFLSTPSARRATRSSQRACRSRSDFYPRPPRGGRQDWSDRMLDLILFLSTPSARRATEKAQAAAETLEQLFLSTPSARRATSISASNLPKSRISIHALREEGDRGRVVLRLHSSISIHALREEGDG